jgi:hypothetical protein
MPEFKSGCRAHSPGGTHEHCCYLGKEHRGMHSCFCGADWDETGTLRIRRIPRRQ